MARKFQLPVGKSGGGGAPRAALRARVAELLGKGLSVQEVAQALGKPLSTIYYHREKLAAEVGIPKLENGVPVPQNSNLSGPIYYRVHDWTLSFPLRFVSEGYARRLKKGNVAYVRGHRVQLFRSRLVVRAAGGTEFRGASHAAAFEAGMAYWERLVRVLEDRWKVSLWKRDGQFGVSCESAEVGNGLARDLARTRSWVRIRDPAEGKTWALVDCSTGPPEFEAVDAVQAGDDQERVLSPFFNDLRGHVGALPLPSEAWRAQLELSEQVRGLVAAVSALVAVQRAQVEAAPRPPVGDASGVPERPDYIG